MEHEGGKAGRLRIKFGRGIPNVGGGSAGDPMYEPDLTADS